MLLHLRKHKHVLFEVKETIRRQLNKAKIRRIIAVCSAAGIIAQIIAQAAKCTFWIKSSCCRLWNSITLSLSADFFQLGDLPLLQVYCTASDRKNQIDPTILKEGVILIHDGEAHPGLRISRDEVALMASLAVRLRLCQSSRTRPESASLKAAHTGARPWDPIDPAAEFFT